MVINQGDIFWIDLKEPSGSEPGYRHPHVIIQNNLFNRSRINTVIVCPLTSNIKRAIAPGNVMLKKGEANLPKKSVVNISQIFTVNKNDLSEKIGSLKSERFQQVLLPLGSGRAKKLTFCIKSFKNASEVVLIDRFSP